MFLRELATAILLPLAAGLLLAIVSAPTAVPIRSEPSLRATPFASFLPEGALLVNDAYSPRMGKTGKTAPAQIWRLYVTDDGAQFQRAFIDLAHAAGAELFYRANVTIPLSELRSYDSHGVSFGAATQDTFTTIHFFKERGPFEVGGRAWRWQVTIEVRDGPCVGLFDSPCTRVPER